MHLRERDAEDVGQFGFGLEGSLRTRADMDAPILALRGNRDMRLEMRVGNLVAVVGALHDDLGLGKALLRVSVFALDLEKNIPPRLLDAGREFLVVQNRRARNHRFLRVEHRRQNFVIHLNETACLFRDALGFRRHRSHALADETGDVIENIGVVRINPIIVMQGRAVRTPRHVLPGKHPVNTGQGAGLLRADRDNVRMGVRRAQDLKMEHSLHLYVGGVASGAGDDGMGQRILQAGAAGVTRAILLDMTDTRQGILDGVVAGAAAKIAL